jgi:hypothetical protein
MAASVRVFPRRVALLIPHQREFGPLRVTFGLRRVVFHLPIKL